MSLANDTSYVPDKLPFSTFSFAGDERSIQFVANSRRFSCDIARYDCSVADTLPSGLPYVKSPDGRWEAFSHEYNLYVCAVARQDERNVEHMHYCLGPNAAAAFPFGVRVRGGVRVAVPFGVRAWRFPFGPVAGGPRPVGGASPTSWPWDALAFWPWAVCGGRFCPYQEETRSVQERFAASRGRAKRHRRGPWRRLSAAP